VAGIVNGLIADLRGSGDDRAHLVAEFLADPEDWSRASATGMLLN
jgi:hypothetical protein